MANTTLALSYECLKLDQGVKAGNAHFYNYMKLDLFCSFYRLHAKHRIDMMMSSFSAHSSPGESSLGFSRL